MVVHDCTIPLCGFLWLLVCSVRFMHIFWTTLCADLFLWLPWGEIGAVPYIPIHTLFGHTHTHPFNGPSSGTTQVSRYQKGKTNLKQETVSGSGISWAICKSAPRSREITMPAPHNSSFFTGRMPFLPPNQQCQCMHWRQKGHDSNDNNGAHAHLSMYSSSEWEWIAVQWTASNGINHVNMSCWWADHCLLTTPRPVNVGQCRRRQQIGWTISGLLSDTNKPRCILVTQYRIGTNVIHNFQPTLHKIHDFSRFQHTQFTDENFGL